jgi:NADH-quinone oxidoreductase subunit H
VQEFADSLIQSWFQVEPAAWPYTQLFYVGVMAAFCALVFFGFLAPFAGLVSWMERKWAARIQSRIGPNRAGPHGILVWLADGIKLFLKEDLIPKDADKILYRLGPYFKLVGLALAFVALPFGAGLIIADLNIGILYIMAVTGLVVVGIIVSGWSSNSKWGLLGGFRSAAQVISYEIPVALAVLVVILSAGTLSTQGIIMAQGGAPWEWFMFRSPMHLVAFVIFCVGMLAEGNRTPFDLPEAEQELVSGFNTEYSGLRFSAFFLAEFANVWVMNAIGVLVFMGGWMIPFVPAETVLEGGLLWKLASFGVFFIKVFIGVQVVLWIRWTLPRIRIDQMMDLCWKQLVPATIVLIVLVAGYEVLVHSAPWIVTVMGIALSALALAMTVVFIRKTRENIRIVGDEVSMENW